MTVQESISTYFDAIVKDMASQNQKVPVDKFRIVSTENGGQLYAPDWFKYMITGRGPGKQPPPERMLAYVQKNPDVISQFEQWFQRTITEKSAAYIMGASIAKRGTRVFRGEVPGVGLLAAMEKNMPDLLADLLKAELLKVQTSLHQKI